MKTFASWAVLLLGVAGCGGSDNGSFPDAGGAAGRPGGAAMTDASDATTDGAGEGGQESPDASGPDGRSGDPCGGPTGALCPEGQYCQAHVNCGQGPDKTGICRVRPRECTSEVSPVCGCDNQSHASSCRAAMVGATVRRAGTCNAPDGSLCVAGETMNVDCTVCTCSPFGTWTCRVTVCPPPLLRERE